MPRQSRIRGREGQFSALPSNRDRPGAEAEDRRTTGTQETDRQDLTVRREERLVGDRSAVRVQQFVAAVRGLEREEESPQPGPAIR